MTQFLVDAWGLERYERSAFAQLLRSEHGRQKTMEEVRREFLKRATSK